MKVILASPTYGHVEPTCRNALMLAVMSAARHGAEWIGSVCPDRMSYSDARNKAVEDTFDQDPALADGIVWVDSDIKPQPDSIMRLLAAVEQHHFDFLSGVYHHRAGEYRPCFYHTDPDGKFRNNVLHELDTILTEGACGFGFVWTSARLILAIKALPQFSKDHGGWFPDHHSGEVSEDMGFCALAHAAGFKLHIDTGIQVAHLGDVQFVTRDTYMRALAAKSPGGVLPKPVSAAIPGAVSREDLP